MVGTSSPSLVEKKTSRLKWYHKLLVLTLPCILALFAGEFAIRWFGNDRNVGPSFTTYDAGYGKRLKPNFSCSRIGPEFKMKLSTNSFGFRGPEPEGPPTGGAVFIGDSFTLGYGVNDGEEFPMLVRKALQECAGDQVPVINMGMGNNGNGRWLMLLENEVPQLSPKLVL